MMILSDKKTVFFVGLYFWAIILVPSHASAVETDSKYQKEQKERTAPQSVGGLLFDFDEGVEVEKGAGASVNVKSNRDYLKSKFREINNRFDELESRIAQIEKKLPQPVPSPKESPKKENSSNSRVLSA